MKSTAKRVAKRSTPVVCERCQQRDEIERRYIFKPSEVKQRFRELRARRQEELQQQEHDSQ